MTSNFAAEYIIREVQVTKHVMELNGLN